MMNEKTKSALRELVRAVLSAVVAFVTALLASSCGVTRAKVINQSNSTTEITIKTSNPTDVNVNPNINMKYGKE